MLYDKKLAYRALQAQEERLMRGLGRYELASSLASSLTAMSEDSGIGLGQCPSTSTAMLIHKSQSLSSISSGTFSLSMIPGNESLEEIAIMDIWGKHVCFLFMQMKWLWDEQTTFFYFSSCFIGENMLCMSRAHKHD